MEENIVGKQQEFHDEKAASVGLTVLNKDNDLVYEDKTLASSRKQYRHTPRCVQTLPFQSQACTALTLQSIIHADKDMTEHRPGLVNVTTPDGLDIVYTAGSPMNVSLNIKSVKYSNESLKLYRKTRSTNMQRNFLIQYASAFRLKKVIMSPIGKWICDSWNDKTANLLKGSLLIQLGDQDSTTSSERASSADTRESNLAELAGPPALHWVSPQKPRKETLHLGKWRSGLDVSDQMLVPFTSTRSHHSELSQVVRISKGLLHCLWKNGIPYFVFFAAEDQNEVLVANPWKVNTSDVKGLDYMYFFHSRTNCEAEDCANRASHIVGKMKVLSCITSNSNGSKHNEHEFVLFGVKEKDQRETQNATTNIVKIKGLSKHMGNIFKIDYSNQKKTIRKSSETNLELENFSREQCLNQLSSMHPSLELAAIVVKDYQTDRRKERTIGGWGLKFLEKIAVVDPFPDSSTSDSSHAVEEKCARSVDVLIPAGLHGGMATGTRGPSTLMERWRSGGNCDCGGWDVGCPLTVLKNRSVHEKAFPLDASAIDCSAGDLFIQGVRQSEPALRLVSMQEGLYAVYFQSNLSALQSFSIGVAFIHTQIQSLLPES